MQEIVQPRDVLRQARLLGARAAEVLYTVEDSYEIDLDHGQIVRQNGASTCSLGIIAWLDEGQMGLAFGDMEGWEGLIREAMVRASTSDPSPLAGPVKGWAVANQALGIDDLRYGQLTENDRRSVLLGCYQQARAVERLADLSDFKYRDSRTRRVFANTKGVLLQEFSTRYDVWGAVSHLPSQLRLEGGVSARTFSSVGSVPFGVLMAQRLSGLMVPQVEIDEDIRVLWPPRVTAEVFGLLAPFFAERSLNEGKTFLSKGKEDPELFDPKILMVDDGSLFGGLQSRGFDDRGVTPVPLTLLREGRVDRCFLSVESAREKDTRATGHATGGQWVPSNLQIRGGTRSLNALMSEMEQRVFYVDHLVDLKKGLNMETGALDVVCSGHLMYKGTKEGTACNVRLRGNLVDALKRLVSLSSDTDRYGHVDAPGMVLDGFHIGA